MRKTLLACLLALLPGLAGPLQADEYVVRPHETIISAYPSESSFLFLEGTAYEIIHETAKAYYVSVKTTHDTILRLEKSELSGVNVIPDDGAIVFNQSMQTEQNQAFLIFQPSQTYPLLEESDGKYRIEYLLGSTRLRYSVAQTVFDKERVRGFEQGETMGAPIHDPLKAMCVINFPDGSAGSGFLLYMDNRLYCMTNQHVLANINPPTIKLADGTILATGKIEFATDRDLARIRILEVRPALQTIHVPSLDIPIRVMGNSLGAGRVTILKGRVTGINQDQIETSAKFVQGNSGSPILTDDNAVVGLATLIETFPNHETLIKGTIFEDGRRVGIRLDHPIDWIEVDMPNFVSRNRLILQTEAFVEELPLAFVLALKADPTQKIAMDSIRERSIQTWIRNCNQRYSQITQKYGDVIRAGIDSGGQRYIYSQSYTNTSTEYARELLSETHLLWSSMLQQIHSKQRLMARTMPYPNTEFMQQSIAHSIDMLEEAASVVALVQERIQGMLNTL